MEAGRQCQFRYLLLSFLLFKLAYNVQGQAEEDETYNGVYIQADGIPSTESRLEWNGTFPGLQAITICFHVRVTRTRGETMSLLSYATEDFPDELMVYFDWGKTAMALICCGGYGRIYHENVINLSNLFDWVHFCLAIDFRYENYIIVLNSKTFNGTIENIGKGSLTLQEGGILMLGQEQDTNGGGFNVRQTYEGQFVNFFVFPKFINTYQLMNFMDCETFNTEDVIVSFQFINKDWVIYGSVEIQELKKNQLCEELPPLQVIFPEHRTFDRSEQLCSMLKGQLATPENEKENKHISEVSEGLVQLCSANWGMYLWLGIKAELRNGVYEYIDINKNTTVQYTSFRKGYDIPTSEYRCVFMDSFKIGQWGVYPCHFKTCSVCTFREFSFLRLRGLCIDSLIDRRYILFGVRNNKTVFNGITNSKILWNNSTWVIENTLDKDVKGGMVIRGRTQYPFGLHRWNIKGDVCTAKSPMLLLTACRSDQYTCNDGTCIRKMQRCDLEVNCPDKSDENNCSAVVVPEDYIKQVPPARIGMEPARVYLHVSIMSMQPIDTLNMKISFDVNVTLMWKDNRLDMLSLNYAETLNVIRQGEAIWQPEFLFEDFTGSEADIIMRWETFVAVMQSGPLPDDITRVREDEVYSGMNNSLKLTQTYHVKVSCQMNFVAYPFDTQQCYFKIRMQYFTQDLVAFNTSSDIIEYDGAETLREYKVQSVKMKEANWHNYSGRKIIILLDNLSGFHIISTYIPTFLMVVIAYSTLYFPLEDFNDRIMVSLTALLVLATLFTQISETTPRTSYMKLLDVWFVATIFLNFSMVILLVSINYLKMQEDQDIVKPLKKKFLYPVTEKSRRMNKICRVLIPAIIFVLVIAYVIFSKLE